MTRLERWEARTTTALSVLAGVFLIAYAVPIAFPGAPQGIHTACLSLQSAIWAVFAVDYGYRLAVAPHRRTFVKNHLLDLAAVTLPALRPLRLLAALAMVQRRAGDRLRQQVALYVATVTVVVVLLSALAVLNAERDAPGSNIHDLGTSLWWAVVTITTVGYGDHFPVTDTGRLLAVGLMISGIALLGIVTASLASWMLDKIRATNDTNRAATAADIATLSAQIDQLRQELRLTAEGKRPFGDTV